MIETVKEHNEKVLDTNDKKCFIVTPIGSANSEIRRNADGVIDSVINPVLIELGFKIENIVVSHRISEIGSINKKIIDELVNDELAIVNLTTLNPNVMYELAVRHATGKPVIIIAEEGTRLPFDIVDERTIFYKNDMQGVVELKDNLMEFCSLALLREQYENPIISAIQENSIISKVQSDTSSQESDFNRYVLEQLEKISNFINNMKIERNTKKEIRPFYFEVKSPVEDVNSLTSKIYTLLTSYYSEVFVKRNVRVRVFKEGNIRISFGPDLNNEEINNIIEILNQNLNLT